MEIPWLLTRYEGFSTIHRHKPLKKKTTMMVVHQCKSGASTINHISSGHSHRSQLSTKSRRQQHPNDTRSEEEVIFSNLQQTPLPTTTSSLELWSDSNTIRHPATLDISEKKFIFSNLQQTPSSSSFLAGYDDDAHFFRRWRRFGL